MLPNEKQLFRADYRIAALESLLNHVHGNKKTVVQCMPFYKDEIKQTNKIKRQSPEDMRKTLRVIANQSK